MSLSSNPAPARPPRATVSLALFAIALLVVAGVGVAATAVFFELRPAAAGHGTITLTDDLGRTVAVPVDPARVAVFGPSIVDSMYRLGLRDRIVGVDCYAPAFGGLSDDYSPDQVTLWNLSSSMCIETAPDFSFESLINDTPQLVLASTIVSVADVEEIQDQYHVPVLMLQPPTLSGIEVDVTMLGQVFNVTAQAAALNAPMQSELAVAENVTANLTDSGTPFPTVLVTYSVDPAGGTDPGYYTYGPGSFGESLIELASGASIAANSTFPYPLLTGDQVLIADPQYIVYGTGYGLNESSYAQGPEWSQFGAVTSGQVYGMDSNWLTEPDPTMILEGLPQLLYLLHPTLVPAP